MKTDAKDLFARAHQLSEEARDVFLEEACGEDTELRLEVQRLLVDSERADSFFANSEGATVGLEEFELTLTESEGDRVGPYVLRQRIGEGGFGTVWMAEQSEPISRMVALKVVKAGMDTRQVLARFEAERQALAMMDHPNIAKVLDAGATESGRPFFVMELVKGIPVTEFCDDQKLGPRRRLELFKDVCSAVNHAHQKGIIHRDLKPSNVMVTLHGDEPVVKVIDFGIAKATQRKLTEKTLFTRFEQFLGTPVYMSPEQAAMSGLDVDTRSDIYSLGVLLYELLAGTPPFDQKSLLSAGYDEMRRIIKEEEPPKPSTRLTQTQEQIAASGAKRRMHVSATALRGDLDWIVMKAIEKDRARRYETANAFAEDIARFLHDEPVLAAKPSVAYKLRKFARRNKAACVGAGAVLLALLLGVAGTTWGMLQARDAAKRAEAERGRADEERDRAEVELRRATAIKGLLAATLGNIDPAEARGADTTLLEGILEEVSLALAGGISDYLVAAELHHILGDVYHSIGKFRDAEKHFQAAVEFFEKAYGGISEDGLSTRNALGLTYIEMDRLADAEELFREILDRHERFPESEERDRLRVRTNLALVLSSQGKFAEAEERYREILSRKIEVMGPNHTDTLKCRNNLGTACYRQGKFKEALEEWEVVLHGRLADPELGPTHPLTLGIRHNVANVRHGLQDFDNLEEEIAERRTIYDDSSILPAAHPYRLNIVHEYADVLKDSDDPEDWDRARRLCGEILALVETGERRPDHGSILDARRLLSELHIALADVSGARRCLEENVSVLEEVVRSRPAAGPPRVQLARTLLSLGYLEEKLRQHERDFATPGPADEEDRAILERQRDWFRGALNHTRELPEPAHPVVIDAGTELGQTLFELRDLEEARTVLEDTLRRAEENPNLKREGVLRAVDVLGGVYVTLDLPDEAVRLLEPAVEEMETLAGELGPDHGINGLLKTSRINLSNARAKSWLGNTLNGARGGVGVDRD